MKIRTNQNILKCLKYPTRDALYQPELTQEEIDNLSFNDDPKEIRISFTPFNLSTADIEKSEIRIFIQQFNPSNYVIAGVRFAIQVIVSNQLWLLDEGKMRPLVLLREILKEIHGEDVDAIGLLYVKEPIRLFNYNSYFSGYEIYPEVRSV
jgi:hypothetical protein